MARTKGQRPATKARCAEGAGGALTRGLFTDDFYSKLCGRRLQPVLDRRWGGYRFDSLIAGKHLRATDH